MVYSYEHYPKHQLPSKPICTVDVINPVNGKSVQEVKALIDTGADISLFPESLQTELGLRCTTMPIRDFSDQEVQVKRATVHIKIKCDDGTLHTDIEVGLIKGEETFIGRDIFNKYKLVLNAPSNKWGVDCSCTAEGCILS